MRKLLILSFLLFASRLDAANRCAPAAVPSGGCTATYGSLQAAIDAAAAGDIVYLHAGQTYTGQITLRNKGILTSYITITSDTSPTNMPAANVRLVGATYAGFMPKIVSAGGGDSSVITENGANHYKFQWVHFTAVPFGFNNMVYLGGNSGLGLKFEVDEPTDFIFDQCYFKGDPVAGQRTAIQPNAKNVTIVNSDFRDIKAVGQDSQCIAASNGHGPIDIENNYLECSTENIIFGGSDPSLRTYMRATGTPTTTTASVTTYETGHTVAELKVGQLLAFQTGVDANSRPIVEFGTLTSITGTGASGTIAWTPALSAPPSVPGDIRGGVVMKGVTIKRNYFTKNPAWQAGVFGPPTMTSATALTGTGTLAAGTYCYKAAAFSNAGYVQMTVNGPISTTEACATLSATGQVTVVVAAVTPTPSFYRIWRGTDIASENQYFDSTTATFVDDGTKTFTAGAFNSATKWQIKNLLELKAAQSVVVDGNIFDYAWKGSDIGFTFAWFKSVNQDGNGWWIQSRDISVTRNLIRHQLGGFLINGREASSGNGSFVRPPPLTNFTFQNNLLVDLGNTTLAEGAQQYSMLINDAVNVTVDHNTFDHLNANGLLAMVTPNQNTGLVITNNMFRKGNFGIHGDALGEGTNSLQTDAPGYTFTNNDIAGASSSLYPAGNFFDSTSTWQGQFTSWAADGSGDYHIRAAATMHNAGTDGKDVGADVTAVLAAVAGVDTGTGGGVNVTTATLPNAVRTVAYSQTVTASGGTAPYTFAVTSGALPTGLAIGSSTGAITGTPTVAGTFNFTVTVTDAAAATAAQAYTVTVSNPVTITTTSPLPQGTINQPYSQTIAYTGGVSPYACTISAGTLTPGLALGTTTCALTGTPTTLGASNFTVRVAGSLGSVATQAYVLTVTQETLPPGRPVVTGPITIEGAIFRRPTQPTAADKVAVGDFWQNTSVNPPTTNVATSSTPTFAPLTFGTDGSALTNLNASQLTTGTLPGTVFPAALTISSSIATGTATFSIANITNYADFTEMSSCGQISASGHTRLCMDSSDHTLRMSQNGSAFTVIGGGSGGSVGGAASSLINGAATVDVVFTDESTDPYGMGDDTTKSTTGTFRSLQGARRQMLRLHDSNSDTGYVWGFGVSNDTGATWTFPFKVRQNGEVHMKNMTLDSQGTPPTCAAAIRGMFWYNAGAAGVKDTVQVCAKDAADAYAWRTIY